MSYTVIVATAAGTILLGPVFDQRTPENAIEAFIGSMNIQRSEITDAAVLLGSTGSVLLHRSSNLSVAHSEPTHDELERAFGRVRPAANWKNPIDTTIRNPGPTGRELISRAIAYYTGSTAEFRPAGRGKVRVVAAGYYASSRA